MKKDPFRFEIEHTAPPVLALRIAECPPELIDLASTQPGHHIWAERLPGTGQLRYVAQRRQGTDAHPYAVVTSELAELRDALRPGLPGHPGDEKS
jgi:hypothetical protein